MLKSDQKLKYYQGYHDIATVFLLTLDVNLAFYCLDAFTQEYLVPYMTEDFKISVIPRLSAIPAKLADNPVLQNIVTADGTSEFPMFATSWLLTLFSHDIEHFPSLERLFDFMIAKDRIQDFIEATIRLNEPGLLEYVTETEDVATAPFVVFRTPLRSYNRISEVDKAI